MTKSWTVTGLLSAGLILFALPPRAEAAVPAPGPVRAAASTAPRYNPQANALFQEIRLESQKAMNQVDELQGLERAEELGWEFHAGQWVQLRAEIDHMGRQLYDLEGMRSSIAPWQQRTINRMAAALVLTADSADGAIDFMNAHQNTLWKATYQQYVKNVYDDAGSLSKEAGNAVNYANTLRRSRTLRREMGFRAS